MGDLQELVTQKLIDIIRRLKKFRLRNKSLKTLLRILLTILSKKWKVCNLRVLSRCLDRGLILDLVTLITGSHNHSWPLNYKRCSADPEKPPPRPERLSKNNNKRSTYLLSCLKKRRMILNH